MKKKSLILSIVVIVVGIIILVLCLRPSNPSLLVVSKFYYFKSGASFGGTAIFDDGSIYNWYYSNGKSQYNGYIGNYNMFTKEGLKSFVLDKAKKEEKMVSYSDLGQIRNLISKLTSEDIKSTCQEDKVIYSTLSFYKYDEEFKIVTSDECVENILSENVSKLQTIVDKYIKKYINYTK